jgi:DNA-binding GntR family transcriptional regulator
MILIKPGFAARQVLAVSTDERVGRSFPGTSHTAKLRKSIRLLEQFGVIRLAAPWDAAVAEIRISADDRASPTPLWGLVAARLQGLIESGRIPVGARIENEVTLAERMGVSRPTMRRSMQELVDRGLLVRKPGAGTQVVMPDVQRPVELTSLHDDLVKSGREPRTEVLSLDIVPASDSLAMALRIPPRSSVTSVERLRYANDEPLALMHNLIPVSVAKLTRADLEQRGLYECLRAAGALPSAATEVIGARTATPSECTSLSIKRGSAVLTMTRTAWSDDGAGVEYGSHIYRADRYAFEHQVKGL